MYKYTSLSFEPLQKLVDFSIMIKCVWAIGSASAEKSSGYIS